MCGAYCAPALVFCWGGEPKCRYKYCLLQICCRILIKGAINEHVHLAVSGKNVVEWDKLPDCKL